MAQYRYVKSYARPFVFPYRLLSYIFLISGIGLLCWTIWPVASFIVYTAPTMITFVSPLPDSDTSHNTNTNTFQHVANVGISLASKTITGKDYTNPNVWYPGKPQKGNSSKGMTYELDIPKLGISKAIVTISGSDLNKSLIHYGGTGLPGEYGNAVVFGHSTLPQFFKASDYTSIFSTLPTLKVGDIIRVKYDEVSYTYEVYDLTVTMPDDLSTLEQRYDDSYLTVVTCVPPGTYAKRLNVKAKLTKV